MVTQVEGDPDIRSEEHQTEILGLQSQVSTTIGV